ncbi:MAG: hypothetical protein KKA42_05755, partial [candidate division Zixibacteria bacterium]|nr:hypothetical protein [candidate division Zixibacteria bacterium]
MILALTESDSDASGLELSLNHRAFPNSSDAWKRDLISATAVIRHGDYTKSIHTTILSQELVWLRQLLLRLRQHEGGPLSAMFRHHCKHFQIRFNLHRLGTLEVFFIPGGYSLEQS